MICNRLEYDSDSTREEEEDDDRKNYLLFGGCACVLQVTGDCWTDIPDCSRRFVKYLWYNTYSSLFISGNFSFEPPFL
jgi:hypothetical protein